VLTVLKGNKSELHKFCLAVKAFFISPVLTDEEDVHVWSLRFSCQLYNENPLPVYRAVVRLVVTIWEKWYEFDLVVINGSFTLLGAELNDKQFSKCTYLKEADACASDRGVSYCIFNVCTVESVRKIFFKNDFQVLPCT
jgi:hypothetical protein